jgi:hypothetical protein
MKNVVSGMCCHVALVITDVSEEGITSNINYQYFFAGLCSRLCNGCLQNSTKLLLYNGKCLKKNLFPLLIMESEIQVGYLPLADSTHRTE